MISEINISEGKVIEASVIGPIKATSDYVKIKSLLHKYEKTHNVVPMRNLTKKTFKINNGAVDIKNQSEIGGLQALIKKTSSDTIDVYYNEKGNPTVSCLYTMAQKLFNKKSKLIINLLSGMGTSNEAYYYLAMCMKYNISTKQSGKYIQELNKSI